MIKTRLVLTIAIGIMLWATAAKLTAQPYLNKYLIAIDDQNDSSDQTPPPTDNQENTDNSQNNADTTQDNSNSNYTSQDIYSSDDSDD